jgi:hypothetical protein
MSFVTVLIQAIREEQASAQIDDGNLSDLDDDDEVAGAIIDESSEHFILRAQLWMESNREYLIEQRGMSLRMRLMQKNGYERKKTNEMGLRKVSHANDERRRRKQKMRMERVCLLRLLEQRNKCPHNVRSLRRSIILLWIDCGMTIRRRN